MDGHDNNAGKDNGNSAASGAQGIFSTPELTVDTNKISQNPNKEKTRVASIFANTDAGQRSQKLNDAMGFSSQPVTEDIVINNGPRKRSKAPLIIVLVLLVLAGVGVGAYYLVQNISQQSESSNTVAGAKQKFDEFATYLLYGQKQDSLTGEYERGISYELDVKFEEENSSEYWNTATTLLNVAIANYAEIGADNINPLLQSSMQSYQQDFEALKEYHDLGDLSVTQLISSLTESGIDIAKTYVQNYYSSLSALEESSDAQDLAEQKILQYTSYVDLLVDYNNAGCLSNGTINETCAGEVPVTDAMTKAQSNIFTARIAANDTVNSLISKLERNCWTISNRFNEPINSEPIKEIDNEEAN